MLTSFGFGICLIVGIIWRTEGDLDYLLITFIGVIIVLFGIIGGIINHKKIKKFHELNKPTIDKWKKILKHGESYDLL